MTSYPFISTLFKSILSKSKAIGGRFYVCPKMGYEINSDMVGEVLKQINTPKKYPLCLMMPPRSNGDFYFITLFFLKETYYGGGNVINTNTQTSTHTIEYDWTDMKRCADGFMYAIDSVAMASGYEYFAITSKSTPVITPVTEIGADRVSGVRLDFQLTLRVVVCEVPGDYDESDIELIEIPFVDGHPEHDLSI